MVQKSQGEHYSCVEVNGAQEAKIIPTDVEHRDIPPAPDCDNVAGGKRPPQRRKRFPSRRPRDFDPLPKRRGRACIFFRPLPDCAFGDDSHEDKMSSLAEDVNQRNNLVV